MASWPLPPGLGLPGLVFRVWPPGLGLLASARPPALGRSGSASCLGFLGSASWAWRPGLGPLGLVACARSSGLGCLGLAALAVLLARGGFGVFGSASGAGGGGGGGGFLVGLGKMVLNGGGLRSFFCLCRLRAKGGEPQGGIFELSRGLRFGKKLCLLRLPVEGFTAERYFGARCQL